MKLKSEKGYTIVDIAVAIVVLFIFVSIIAFLSYGFNSSAKEIELKSEATALAVQEIEALKNSLTFEEIANKSINNEDKGVYLPTTEVEGKEGFFKTVIIEDYADKHESKVPNLVKKVSVQIQYKFKTEIQTVELSTIIAKEK